MPILNKKNTENIFLGISILLFLWIRYHHFFISLERDEGEFAYAGQELLRGKLPYKDFYNMKFPGVYYVNALIFYIFGDSIFSIKFSLIFFNLSSSFFLFRLTSLWYNQNIGKLASGIFLIFCSCYSSQGWTANAEHFVVFFGLIGIYFYSLHIKNNKLIYLFLSGLFLAFSTICKQHGVFYAVFPVLDLVSRTFLHNSRELLRIVYLRKNFIYALGFMFPIAIMLGYFLNKNTLNEFYFLTFIYASAYSNLLVPFLEIWHFRPIFWEAFGFWILVFSMIYLVFRKKNFFIHNIHVFLLLICSFIATSFGWYYRPHYFQLMFPVSAIMSAYLLNNIENLCGIKLIKKEFYLSVSIIFVLIIQSPYLFFETSQKITDKMYPPDNFFNEKKVIADSLIKFFGDKNYKIGIIGNEPEILFYTKKVSASGFLYVYPLVEKHKYAELFTQKFIAELEASKPEIFLYFTDYKDSSPENPKTAQQITDFYNRFKQNYIPIGRMDSIGDNKVQLTWRTKEKSTINVDSAFYGAIYLRKDLEINDK